VLVGRGFSTPVHAAVGAHQRASQRYGGYFSGACDGICAGRVSTVIVAGTTRWEAEDSRSSFLSWAMEPHPQLHGAAFGRPSIGELSRKDIWERVMMTVGELLDRDFKKPIEEIIKVNNADEETVFSELTEYIATDRIKAEYEHLFRAMADAPKTPSADAGVWISGFFG